MVGVSAGNNLAGGLVIRDYPGALRAGRERDRLAVDRDSFAAAYPLPECSRQAIDQDAPGLDPCFDLAPRPISVGGQHFLDAFG